MEKAQELPDLRATYENSNMENKVEMEGKLGEKNVFDFIPDFQRGQYYYVAPYVLFEDEVILDVEDGFDEVFIGDYWEFRDGDTYEDSPDYLFDAFSCSINGKGYVVTGWENVGPGEEVNQLTKALWEYNSKEDCWKSLTDFPGTAQRLATGFVLNEKMYVGTGLGVVGVELNRGVYTVRSFPTPSNSMRIYTPNKEVYEAGRL